MVPDAPLHVWWRGWNCIDASGGRGHTTSDIGSLGLAATVCVSAHAGLSQTFLVEVNLRSIFTSSTKLNTYYFFK